MNIIIIKNQIAKYFILFIFYSFIGWVYEIAYETFLEHWTFMPREFFRGPICPIYGITGVLLFIIFTPLMKNNKLNVIIKLLTVFIGTFFVSTVLELIMSYVLEITTGAWPWQSYVNYSFNFGGRISLPTSIKFAFLGVVFVFLMFNTINKFVICLLNNNILIKLAIILFIIFLFDTIFAIIIPTNIKLNIERTKLSYYTNVKTKL